METIIGLTVSELISIATTFLPALGAGSATTAMVSAILGIIGKIVPLLIDIEPTVVQAFNNIVTSLKASGAPMTADQVAQLIEFEQAGQAAFDAAAQGAGADPTL